MRTIAIRMSQAYGAAPLDTLVFDANRFEETIKWTRIVAVLHEGHARMITLFFRAGTTDIMIKQETPRTARDSVQTESDLYVSGQYRIGMRVTNGDNGSIMELSAFGIVEDPVTV